MSNGCVFFPHLGHAGASELASFTCSIRQSPHLQTCFLPPSLPLLATLFPSAWTMSKAKSVVGALLTEVPTPKPSAPASARFLTEKSVSPPETKILTLLQPRESSSQRTSRIISAKSPLLELGVSKRTPYRSFPKASVAIIASVFSS